MKRVAKTGTSLVGGTVFAVVGWALSLTIGPRAQRWPWILVGGLIGIGLVLILFDRIVNRFRRRSLGSLGDESQPREAGRVIFHDDGSVEMYPLANTLGASVGPVGPDQKVFYAEAIPTSLSGRHLRRGQR